MLRLSRAELYELIWSKPMKEIARQFDIRDQHIAQACDYYDIARPRAGHWQKVEHGKAVERIALGSDRFSAGETIVIDSKGWRAGQEMQDERHEDAGRQAA